MRGGGFLGNVGPTDAEPGFVSCSRQRTWMGWQIGWAERESGYGSRMAFWFAPRRWRGGNLFTKRSTATSFRFEFRLFEGSNNGIGIRAPWRVIAAYVAEKGKWRLRSSMTGRRPVPGRKLKTGPISGYYDVDSRETGIQKPYGRLEP